jgi:glycosyltransferase involved in cell wall biosynthesis
VARPIVSTVVAAHQAARHLGAALTSLAGQTLDDLEVIVVDDGSTDGTAAVADGFARTDPRFQVVRLERNRGQAAALNVGLDLARGRYLAVLDADDEATPGRLEHQIPALERDPGLVLLGGAVVTLCDRHAVDGRIWRYATSDAAVRARTLFKSEVISGAVTFDRECMARHRVRFDERLRLGVDWAISAAAMRIGRVGNVEPVVMRYRIHPGQMTVEMVDDLTSDSTRIRREVLAWAGIHPTEAEMRTHLAVSPCNYWPFGAHPFFRERGEAIRGDAERWLGRLLEEAERGGRIPLPALREYVEEILSMTDRALREPRDSADGAMRTCPVAAPLLCGTAEPCR